MSGIDSILKVSGFRPWGLGMGVILQKAYVKYSLCWPAFNRLV